MDMNRKTVIIIGAILLAFAGLVGISVSQKQGRPVDYSSYKYTNISKISESLDLSSVDTDKIIPASEESGNLSETVEGDPEKAKVIIFEYADFQCPYCALYNNSYVVPLIEKYGDKVAVVFRSYVLSYHTNGIQASSAAIAAGLQGYWQEYKNLLFESQDDWSDLTGSKLQKQLEDYFVAASADKGDLEKFREDMKSEAVAKKIAFDMAVGSKVGITGTPSYYLDGEAVKITEIDSIVEEKLKEK